MPASSGARGDAKAAQRLDTPEARVLGEGPECRGRGIDADGMQPAAADPDARPQSGGAGRGRGEWHAGPHEEPHGDDGIPRPHARQDGRDGGAPLRREARGQEREPQQSAHGA